MVMTESNIIWLCLSDGQLNLLLFLKTVVSATVVKVTYKIKQGAYMKPQALCFFPLSTCLSSPP